MDFTYANMRAPWGFVWDTDAVWNLKMLAEKKHFPEWQLREGDAADQRLLARRGLAGGYVVPLPIKSTGRYGDVGGT